MKEGYQEKATQSGKSPGGGKRLSGVALFAIEDCKIIPSENWT